MWLLLGASEEPLAERGGAAVIERVLRVVGGTGRLVAVVARRCGSRVRSIQAVAGGVAGAG